MVINSKEQDKNIGTRMKLRDIRNLYPRKFIIVTGYKHSLDHEEEGVLEAISESKKELDDMFVRLSKENKHPYSTSTSDMDGDVLWQL